jgi:uncharacterized protein YqhQ
LTTREPDEGMLAVAIAAFQAVRAYESQGEQPQPIATGAVPIVELQSS